MKKKAQLEKLEIFVIHLSQNFFKLDYKQKSGVNGYVAVRSKSSIFQV